MERSNCRSSSKLSNSSDPKIKQDVTNKHLYKPRVKESVSPRPEARRKPNPQKSREVYDKRPRNRPGAVCERYRSEVTEETLEEVYSRQGSKKTNLNHLLNFTVTPLDNRDGGIRRVSYNRNKHPKYNKELFLQANCQFVARDTGNYSVHEKNPDILVEWSLIEEIRLPSYEMPSCPICLYSPTAAKITRCGHIYCWPCILHYLALTDRTWQKCPICFEAVHKSELKSVTLRIQKSVSVGDEITMCLMKRIKGSLLTAPITHGSPKQICNVDCDDSVIRFQKLLLANKSDIYQIINRERKELNDAYIQEKNNPEACFIESALKLLEERENNMTAELPANITEEKGSELVMNASYQHKHLESLSSTDSHEEIFQMDPCDQNFDFHCSETVSKNPTDPLPESEKKGISYFYQAEDGQHIYMHHLNVRMLVKEYGSLENAPPIIKAKIVEIESVSMTDILRKKLRYLQHLPLSCEFQVAELNFSNILMKSTILHFEGEISRRKQFRNKKARDERRREKYIELEENRKLGKYPKATYNLQSVDQFPSCDISNFQPLSPPKLESVSPNNNFDSTYEFPAEGNSPNDSFLPPMSDSEANYIATPSTSFAQMLKDGAKNFNQPPKVKQTVFESHPSPNINMDMYDEENWVPAPEYHQSFSDAIQAALDSVTLQDSPGNGQKSGRKKKGKKQLLFTTSMCRNNK